MKVKTLLSFFIVIMIVATSIATFYPYYQAEKKMDGLQVSPFLSGSTSLYQFSVDRNSYSNNTNSVNDYAFPSGYIMIKGQNNNNVLLQEIVFNSLMNKSYAITLHLNASSSFLSIFFNSNKISEGGFTNIGEGILGPVHNDNDPYYPHLSGVPKDSAKNLSRLVTNFVYTIPEKVNLIGVNETGISKSSLDFWLSATPNGFSYDKAKNGINVLVRGFVTGFIPFLGDVFNTTSLQYSVSFEIFLIGTNVGLYPIDQSHYMTEYIGIITTAWIIGTIFTAMTIRSTKRRYLRKK